ncbi:MAG: BspA family leucine-rich repeat surface protein [Lachnospiraceae bacterium]|nr:BspA family leucine-rich repeat surface protein [Lachnospiraceae bacterium]
MICTKCGAKVKNGARFCSICGNTIETAVPDEKGSVGLRVRGFFSSLPIPLPVLAAIVLVLAVGGVLLYFNVLSPTAVAKREVKEQIAQAEKYEATFDHDQAAACYKAALAIDPSEQRARDGLRDNTIARAELAEAYDTARADEILTEGEQFFLALDGSANAKELAESLAQERQSLADARKAAAEAAAAEATPTPAEPTPVPEPTVAPEPEIKGAALDSANGVVKKDVEESPDYTRTLPELSFYSTKIARKQISTVTFRPTLPTEDKNATDVSEGRRGKVFVWFDENDEGNYDVTFAADGTILLPEDSSWMFAGCNNLTSIDFGGCVDTRKVKSMSGMFLECGSLASVDLSAFDTSAVTKMRRMFCGCHALTSLDLSSFDTSGVTSMKEMFKGCDSLTRLNLSTFDTANVTDMAEMFRDCSTLSALNVSGLNTANVTTMRGMFASCAILANVDLSSFDTANVTDMSEMFADDPELQEPDLGRFDTAKVSDMHGMFSGCAKFASLDLSSFDFSKLEDAAGMFDNTSGLSVTVDQTKESWEFFKTWSEKSANEGGFPRVAIKESE